MKQMLVALVAGLYGLTAFGVAETQTVKCAPGSGFGPVYSFSVTTGGAPGHPVYWFTVTREQAGFQSVSSTFDLTKYNQKDAKLQYGGVGPVQDGSAFLYDRVFGTTDANGKSVTTGYISIYVRSSVGASVVDVQLPADAPNATLLNTTPPLTGYVCTVHGPF